MRWREYNTVECSEVSKAGPFLAATQPALTVHRADSLQCVQCEVCVCLVCVYCVMCEVCSMQGVCSMRLVCLEFILCEVFSVHCVVFV